MRVAGAGRGAAGAAAAARALATAVAPFYSADAMRRTLAVADDVTARVPSYDLAFAPSPRVVDDCLTAL